MVRKSLILTGTVLLALGAIIALFAFLSPPTTKTYAAPPPGCQPITQDIISHTIWSAPCYEIMTTTVTINPGIVLTISPTGTGTSIYFQTGTRLQVEGNLQALGTASRPITFTASDPTAGSPCGGQGRWLGIIFGTSSIHNRIQHTLIEYACTGIAPSGSTNEDDGDWILSNTLRYNGGTGAFNGGIGGDIDYSEIRYNTIYSCSDGIILNEGSHNTMSDNVIRDIADTGLHLIRGGTGGGNYNTISHNDIYNCAGAGIQVEDSHYNEITNNAVYQCGAEGIRLDTGSSNQVLSNTIHSTMLTASRFGGAVSLLQQNGMQFRGNHLYNNGGGSGYQAAVYVGATPDYAIHQIAANVIHNQANDAIEYAASNGNAGLIAQNNALCSIGAFELRDDATARLFAADARYSRWGFPDANTPTNGINFTGMPNVTPWITLSIPASDAYGVVTVTMRARNGTTFVTVPRAPTSLPVDSPIPNARRVTLTSNWGHFATPAVLLDDTGLATAQLVPSTTVPTPAHILVTVTDFCGQSVSAPLAIPDLAITKTALTTQAVVGGLVTYRIDYANHGDAAAAGLAIQDTLPVGMQWVADTAVPPWTRAATTPEIVWTLPGLAAGAGGSFVVTTTVNSAAACGLQLTNLAVITSTTLEARLDNNASSAAPVTVLCPSIEITKTGPTLSKVTDVVTYTYQIRNTSVPASAPPLDVVSIVDTGVGWPGLGNLTVRGCTPLTTGAVCTFQVPYTVAVGAPDPLANVVTATYRLTAFNQTVTATDSHSVNLFQPAITFSKTGDPLSKVGDAVTYTLTLDNASSADAPDLQCRITDALLGLDQPVTLAWNAAPYVVTRPYTVPAGAPDPLINTANVTCSPLGFPNIITATATHSVNLFQPSITFAKTGDPLSKIGDSTAYTLTLDNTSSNDTPDLQCRITDAMLGLDQAVTLAWNAPLYVLTRAYTVPAGAPDPLVNTANVTCSPAGFPNVITASDNHTVNLFQPAVQVNKSGPAEAHPGDTITYTFRITNTGSLDSPALILDAITDVGVGWPGLGDLTARATANGCASLAAGAGCMFTTTYAIPAGTPNGEWGNMVSVRYHPLGFLNQITDTDTHTLTIAGAIDLFVAKDDNVGPPGPIITYTLSMSDRLSQSEDLLLLPVPSTLPHRAFVFPGDLITYPIFICNYGEITATNVVLTETIPEHTTYVERGFGWSHVITRVYTLSVGTLSPGCAQWPYWMVVQGNDDIPPQVNNLDNLVCGDGAEAEMNSDNNCNREDTPLRRRPEITKTLGSTVVVDNAYLLEFVIAYHNPNPMPFTEVWITDTFPTGFSWYSDTAPAVGWTERVTFPGGVSWYTPTLGVGARGSFSVWARVSAETECGSIITNTVILTLLNSEVANYFGAQDTLSFTLECAADLWVIKNDQVGPLNQLAYASTTLRQVAAQLTLAEPYREYVYEGDIVTYTIVAMNAGPYTATHVVLTETLPLHTSYVGFGWRHVGGRTYTMTLGTLAPSAYTNTIFVIQINNPVTETITQVDNIVCIGGAEPNPDPMPNCWREDTPVRLRSLRISKTAPVCIIPGSYFNYNVFYTNTHATANFVNVPITDTLSPYVIHSEINPTWRCETPFCYTSIPSIPARTFNARGPSLSVYLKPSSVYTNGTPIANTIEISGGYRYTLTSFVDLGPDLIIVKNDNIGPLPGAQQALWEEMREQRALLTMSQSAAQPLFARPGDLITYTIVYRNRGIGAARDVIVTEQLPNYTTFVGGRSTRSGSPWTHSGGRYYTINAGTIEPGGSDDLTFIVRVNKPFPLGINEVTNEVRITTPAPECDTGNNVSSDHTPIRTNTLLYVANRDSDTIDVFRTTDFAYMTSFNTGDRPFGMAVVQDQLYVANNGAPWPAPASQVQAFSLTNHRLITNIPTGYGTLYLTALEGYVYATNHDNGENYYGGEGVTVIEHTTHNVFAHLKPDRFQVYNWGFFGITADPTRHVMYSTKRYMGAQGLWTIPSPLGPLNFSVNTGSALPYSTIYNRATDHIYVTFPHLNEVRVYDPRDFSQWRVFPTEAQAPSPESTDGGKGMAVMGQCTYNANFAAQSVSVIAEGLCDDLTYSVASDTTQNVILSHTAIPRPDTILLSPEGTLLLGDFHIYLPLVMRAWQSYPNVTHIKVEGRPKGLAAGGGIVFVTLPEQNRVAVIDTRTGKITYIPTQGNYPHTAVIIYDAPWLDQ